MLIRELVGFDSDDELMIAHEVPEEKISELRPLFSYGDDEGLHAGSYEVTAAIRGQVAVILGVSLDPNLDYFIESSLRS